MLRCAITDREYRPGMAVQWARNGIDFLQLRDKEAGAKILADCARETLATLRNLKTAKTRLLINSRADIAAAVGADGVHLTSHPDELSPEQAREIFANADRPNPLVSISCHSLAEVERASEAQVDLILFGPVFEKRVNKELIHEGIGLQALHAACIAACKVPVLALGGVTTKNADACLAEGAAGIAGIRLFR